VPAVKSRLLRARLQLREKLTRFSSVRETTSLLTCRDFLRELSEFLDENLDAEVRRNWNGT